MFGTVVEAMVDATVVVVVVDGVVVVNDAQKLEQKPQYLVFGAHLQNSPQ